MFMYAFVLTINLDVAIKILYTVLAGIFFDTCTILFVSIKNSFITSSLFHKKKKYS